MNNLIEVRSNPILGRYLVTKDEIIGDEVIIEEHPFIYGPKLNSPVICLGCYCKVECGEDGSRCQECKWPLCEDCTDYSKDHQEECKIFKAAKVKFQSLSDDTYGCPQLDCITPLRLLLKMQTDPERWQKEVIPMEYHDEPRRENKEIWNADLVNVAKYLRGPCKLTRFSEDIIMRAIGILEVNAFEARTSLGYPIRCLFPITGILAHSCVPNTARSIYPSENYRVRLRAMVDLKEGKQLNHSYTYTLDGTTARQEHLKAGKYFCCNCERCSDPTELGTYFSSFRCKKCVNGLISTTNPFDTKALWKCSHCNFTVSGEELIEAIASMQSEVEYVYAMEMSPERLEAAEILYRKYASILSPLHFLQTGLRQSLIEMYGRVEGYEMGKLTTDQLKYKEDLCRQVLKVLNVFEPGLSRSRALMLYELHVPVVLLAKSQFFEGNLSTENFKIKLQEAINHLYECHSILDHEDPVSQEGTLSRIAQQALEQLRDSIDTL